MKFVAIVLISTMLSPAVGAAVSQNAQPITPWDALAKLPAGARVRLVLTDGSIATGRLVQVEADAITLADVSLAGGRQDTAEPRESRSFPSASISSVEEVPQKRMSGLAKVLTVGAIVGGAIAGYYFWLLANSR